MVLKKSPFEGGAVKFSKLLQRNFLNWSMGLDSRTYKELARMRGFRDMTKHKFTKLLIRNSEHRALRLLKFFYKPQEIVYK